MRPSPSEGVRGARPSCLLVASGKGGVGTSCIAALVALAAAARGEQVLLVDATESAGAQHQLFGVRPSQSIWMLADSRVHPDNALVDLGDNLTILAGGTSGGAVTPSSDHERRTALTRLAHVYSRYSFIVFDGGSRLDTVTAISELVDPSLLLVTSADRLALAANYALVKCVCTRRPNAIVSVLANRHGESVASEACEFLVGACTHFLNRTIDIAGSIPDDPCLQAAVGAGMSIHDAFEGSPASDAVRDLITRFIPTWPTDPQPQGQAASLSATSSPSSRRWS
ncbi:MAG TPA: P-loop NTPase [Gemmatimonadaceae bacterium]